MHIQFPHVQLFQGIIPLSKRGIYLDTIAGITLAALAIPEVMGYAKIAGMPVVTGLYTLLLPMAIFAIFCSSRHLVIGADSATAAILIASLVHWALPDSPHYIALAGMVSLLTGGFLLLSRIFRISFIADFLSRTVLIGFLTGVGIQVALSQLPGILGITPGNNPLFPPIYTIFSELPQAQLPAIILSLLVIFIIFVGERIQKSVPWTLLIVMGSIVMKYFFAFMFPGIKTLGQVPAGLPIIGFPDISFSEIPSLVSLAFSCFIIILAQSAATSRAYASKYQEILDENADLVGLGVANIAAGLSGTFVVNGSPTKTEMIDRAGGRTQFAHLVTVIVVFFVLLFLTAPLAYLPEAVLASIVFGIGIRLVDISGLKNIQSRRPVEYGVALATAISVIIFGVGWGIAFAMFLSMIAHLRHSYHPLNYLLYPDENGKWSSAPRESGKQAREGLIIYRFGANLYYANEGRMNGEIKKIVRLSKVPISWFCFSGSSVNDIDYSASETLIHLNEYLKKKDIRFVFCDVEEHVREEMIRDNLENQIGKENFFRSKEDVVQAFDKYNNKTA
jgi:high affinity sulfate transporter 1